MNRRTIVVVLSTLFVVGCAHVPRESVELSATVGRDLAVVHTAHRELAQVLFARMRDDINRFVDEVYAPFQIRNVMNLQFQLARSENPEEQAQSLLLAINAAFRPDASPEVQDWVLEAMGIMVRRIRAEVDSVRNQLLDPIDAQEAEVLGSIDRAYQQLHYANSIVTGHLSSVVKVHETQAELLEAIGIERDLRSQVGGNLARASDKIAGLVEAAETAEARLSEVEENAKKLMEAVSELKRELEAGPEEE